MTNSSGYGKNTGSGQRGEVFTARIERLASDGSGILSRDGQKVFVQGSAPGDIANVRIVERRAGWARAILVEIIEPSPDRVEAPCPLFGICGACSLAHLSYDAQIAAKSGFLQDAFVRIGGFTVLPPLLVKPSAAFGYRNRVQFHRAKKNAVGFMAKQSGTVIPLRYCPVADAGINRALVENRILPPFEKDRFTVYSYGDTFLSEGGTERGTVKILDRNLLMDVGVFFQSNAVMLEQVVGDLSALAKEAPPLPAADLYAGVGTFAAFLQGLFPALAIVEENKTAISIAHENVRGVEYFALPSDKWATLQKAQRKTYGFVVADPPRQGLSSGIRAWLCRNGPPLFVYLSCDPATLARDSRDLAAAAYTLTSLTLYDFYPQTVHVESMAVFQR
jgi:23S rRNA (uracil1939-C5)-methyltransferase